MKKGTLYFLTMLGILVFALACADEEVAVPQVIINSPAGGSSYAFGDTIVLEFTAEPADRVRFFLNQKEEGLKKFNYVSEKN